MKLAMVIIGPNMYYETSQALIENGFYALTQMEVMGRGKERMDYVTAEEEEATPEFLYDMTAKRLIEVYIRDDQVDALVQAVLRVNQKNHSGDGKIFILPVDDGYRIRTGETGTESIM